MSRIVVQAFVTLDGVVQAGGGPDEDRDGGFEHGGWPEGYDDGGSSRSGRAGPRLCCSGERRSRTVTADGLYARVSSPGDR